MNKQGLDKSIQSCIKDAGMEVYFVMKDNNIFKANIRQKEQNNLKQIFIAELNETIINNPKLIVMNISTADERQNIIYEYDMDIPDNLSIINSKIFNENTTYFSFDENKLSDINAIILLIGDPDNQILIYKQNNPLSIFRKDSGGLSFTKKRNENLFVEMDNDVLKINSKFDFFKIEDKLFILNIKTLERFFGFHEVIKTEAEKGIKEIEKFELIDNIDSLRELLDEVSFARKLTKISQTSPVLGHVANEEIIKFASNHPALKNKLKANKLGTKFTLNTKKAKQLFLKLLNDDYLTSDLTSKYYDSLAKDSIESELNN